MAISVSGCSANEMSEETVYASTYLLFTSLRFTQLCYVTRRSKPRMTFHIHKKAPSYFVAPLIVAVQPHLASFAFELYL